MFSRSKAARWRSGERMALRARSARLGWLELAGRGADPGVLDDRGEVDVADVGVPVDGGRVEAERPAVVGVHPVPQGQQAVDPVEGLGLGVGAVELDVAEGPVGQQVLLLEGGHPRRLAAPDGQRAHHLFGQVHGLGGPGQLALDPAPAGERPRRHHDGLAVGVVERVLGEPALDQLDQAAVAERVPHAGGHVVDARPLVLRLGSGQQRLGGHGDDGRHHQVDRDDVGDPLGHPGELPQQAPGVGDDDRLGHPEAADPARSGLGQGRLDDRGPDDGHGHGVAVLGDQGPLAQGLGVGVGVGPSEGLGPGLARGHHLLLDPVLAQSFGPLGQEVEPGAPELAPGLLGEAGQPLGPAGLGVEVAALAPGGVDLGAPVHLDAEAVGVEELLFGLALVGAGHVGGGHREEVDRSPAVPASAASSRAAATAPATRDGPSRLTSTAESSGRVEADRGGRVDDHVALGQQLQAVLVEARGRRWPRRRPRPITRDATSASNRSPCSWRSRSKQSFLRISWVARCSAVDRRPGRMSSTTRQSGTLRSMRSTRAVPKKSGGAGDEELLAGQGVADTGHRICLPYGK